MNEYHVDTIEDLYWDKDEDRNCHRVLSPVGKVVITFKDKEVALDVAFLLNDARKQREILSDKRTPSDYLWDLLGMKP